MAVFCCILISIISMSLVSQLTLVEGLYIVQVQLHGYDNPTQQRFISCNETRCLQTLTVGCCDGDIDGECTSDNRRCDTNFLFCLRPLNSQFGCDSNRDDVMQSNFQFNNDANFDFTRSTFLGLNNPLVFQGLTNAWNVSHDV